MEEHCFRNNADNFFPKAQNSKLKGPTKQPNKLMEKHPN